MISKLWYLLHRKRYSFLWYISTKFSSNCTYNASNWGRFTSSFQIFQQIHNLYYRKWISFLSRFLLSKLLDFNQFAVSIHQIGVDSPHLWEYYTIKVISLIENGLFSFRFLLYKSIDFNQFGLAIPQIGVDLSRLWD